MTQQRSKNIVGFIMVGVGLMCPLSLAPCPLQAAEMKIGYVNLAKLFDGYQRTKEFEQSLQQKGGQREAQLKGQANDLKKLRDSLELLNAQAREAKQKEIEEKADEFQRLKTRAERDLVRERNEMAKTILDEIEQTVTGYAKANGFSLVVDQRSRLYGQDSYDLTDALLKTLNEKYAGRASAKPAAATPPAATKPPAKP